MSEELIAVEEEIPTKLRHRIDKMLSALDELSGKGEELIAVAQDLNPIQRKILIKKLAVKVADLTPATFATLFPVLCELFPTHLNKVLKGRARVEGDEFGSELSNQLIVMCDTDPVLVVRSAALVKGFIGEQALTPLLSKLQNVLETTRANFFASDMRFKELVGYVLHGNLQTVEHYQLLGQLQLHRQDAVKKDPFLALYVSLLTGKSKDIFYPTDWPASVYQDLLFAATYEGQFRDPEQATQFYIDAHQQSSEVEERHLAYSLSAVGLYRLAGQGCMSAQAWLAFQVLSNPRRKVDARIQALESMWGEIQREQFILSLEQTAGCLQNKFKIKAYFSAYIYFYENGEYEKANVWAGRILLFPQRILFEYSTLMTRYRLNLANTQCAEYGLTQSRVTDSGLLNAAGDVEEKTAHYEMLLKEQPLDLMVVKNLAPLYAVTERITGHQLDAVVGLDEVNLETLYNVVWKQILNDDKRFYAVLAKQTLHIEPHFLANMFFYQAIRFCLVGDYLDLGLLPAQDEVSVRPNLFASKLNKIQWLMMLRDTVAAGEHLLSSQARPRDQLGCFKQEANRFFAGDVQVLLYNYLMAAIYNPELNLSRVFVSLVNLNQQFNGSEIFEPIQCTLHLYAVLLCGDKGLIQDSLELVKSHPQFRAARNAIINDENIPKELRIVFQFNLADKGLVKARIMHNPLWRNFEVEKPEANIVDESISLKEGMIQVSM